MTPQAKRQRAWRQRRATGVKVLQVPVLEYELVSALLEANRLFTIEALDPGAVSRATSEVLGEWSRRWLEQ